MTTLGAADRGTRGESWLALPLEAGGGDAVDQRIGWMVSVGSLFLYVGSMPSIRDGWEDFAPWWSAAAVALMVGVALAAAAGPVLPMPGSRLLWRGFPVASLVLLAAWTAARTSPGAGADTGPWAWVLEPTAVAFAALVWPMWAAVVYSQASALTVLVAALAADGHASRGLLVMFLLHLSNVAFVVIFVGIRRQLSGLRDSEQQAAASVARLARARAEEAEHARLATIVHDEVLATLNLASHATGPLSASLVEQARRARIAVLGGSDPADASAAPVAADPEPATTSLPAATVVESLRARVAALAPGGGVHVKARADDVDVPCDAAEAVLAAVEEAVRNSVEHAAGGVLARPVTRVVDMAVDGDGLTATIADDGVGFDTAAVEPRRLGVRRSILARMAAVPGGTARVDSARGYGTTVTLLWRRG
ncbi:MAG TPA: ATP-binding protein [Cellulomonas sp.]